MVSDSPPSRPAAPQRSSVLLAIDGGGTLTRCVAFDLVSRRELARAAAGPCNPFEVGIRRARQSLEVAASRALASAGANRLCVAGICAGLASIELDGTGLAESRKLITSLGHEVLGLYSDLIICHHAALGGGAGAVAVAGTGSAAIAVDHLGRRHSADGWGPLVGDEGSGFWIGRECLRAVARHCDGRGQPTLLTEYICTKLGVQSFPSAIIRLHAWRHMVVRNVAGLARIVEGAALEGDAVAHAILTAAAQCMAETLRTAVLKMEAYQPDIRVSYQGSMFDRCPVFREKFLMLVRLVLPDCVLIDPKCAPVYGALSLGLEELRRRREQAT